MSAPSSDLQQSWFHPDCWAAVLSAKQKDYLRQVETGGLEALLAPYISAAPAGSKVDDLVVAQAKSTDIRANSSAAPLDRPESA